MEDVVDGAHGVLQGAGEGRRHEDHGEIGAFPEPVEDLPGHLARRRVREPGARSGRRRTASTPTLPSASRGPGPRHLASDPDRLDAQSPRRGRRDRRAARGRSAPRSSRPRRAAGVVLAAATASARAIPASSTVLATARSMRSTEPTSVPSAIRGGPASTVPVVPVAEPVPVPVATASVTRTVRAAPLARKAIRSRAGWMWTRSAMRDTASRSSASAAPRMPGWRAARTAPWRCPGG